MSRITTLSLLLALVASSLLAQPTLHELRLVFEHTIDGQLLEMRDGLDRVYQTPNGVYRVSRMQYYLSGLRITHSGGQELVLDDTYLLVDGNQTDYSLGMQLLGNPETLHFDVGVDADANHLDPASYPPSHPLAYQNPSMHWGWVSGYRFAAFEGQYDNNGDGQPNAFFEYHPVGDEYLQPVSVDVSAGFDVVANVLTIYLRADYDRLFNDPLQLGGVYHGGGGIIAAFMQNFANQQVFTASLVSADSEGQPDPAAATLTLSPNPLHHQGVVHYELPAAAAPATLQLFDTHGRSLRSWTQLPAAGQVVLERQGLPAGLYLLALQTASGQLWTTQKVLID